MFLWQLSELLVIRSSFLSLYVLVITSLTAKTINRVISERHTIHRNMFLRMALSALMSIPIFLVKKLTSGF